MNPDACIRCEKPIEWLGQNYEDLPKQAVIFTSHGNYGSRVFDQIYGEQVVIVVCDECMRSAGNHIQVRRKRHHRTEYEDLGNFTEWDANEDAKQEEMDELMRDMRS